GGAEVPTISSNIEDLMISSRKATFSFSSRCSACLRLSISVPATYQRRSCPCSSRSGLQRKRNQRYSPSFLSKRTSVSCERPLEKLVLVSLSMRTQSSG